MEDQRENLSKKDCRDAQNENEDAKEENVSIPASSSVHESSIKLLTVPGTVSTPEEPVERDRNGEKTTASKKKSSIPTIVVDPGQLPLPAIEMRRLSLQLQSQPDKDVDQCRRRLSKVDISRSPQERRLSETAACMQQKEPPILLSLLPKSPEGRPPRSPSASRIPIQRSRSTPPPRQRQTAQPKLPPQATIPEHEPRSSDRIPGGMIRRAGQPFAMVGNCSSEDVDRPPGETTGERKMSAQRERGRTGPRGNGSSNKRRASTAGVTPQSADAPRARRSLSFSGGCQGGRLVRVFIASFINMMEMTRDTL